MATILAADTAPLVGGVATVEQLSTTTLLGLRFQDPAQERPILDDLVVTATPAADLRQRPRVAFRTGGGVYAFQGLPGLRHLEHGALPAESPPATTRFVVAVKDNAQRFLPALVQIDLPLPYRGLYRPGGVNSPPLDDGGANFYLFSAPTRTPPPGTALLRAQLYDQLEEKPAAFALLEVQMATQRWVGLTAENGSAVVIFPYPTFTRALGNGSPPPLSRQQQWPLTLRIYYEPAVLDFLPGYTMPDLRSIRRQRPAQLFLQEGGPPVDEVTDQLLFAEEFRLATDGLSHLLLAPAPSSP